MKKKKHKSSGHSVAKEFPSQGSPMDISSHPLNNLPDPTGGMFNPGVQGLAGPTQPDSQPM